MGQAGDERPSVFVADEPAKSELKPQDWVRAWNIFLAIYAQNYPGEIGGLVKHYQKVDDLMSMGADWRGYDASVRREIQGGRLQWGGFNAVIYTTARLRFIRNEQQGRQPSFQGKSKFQTVPHGFCRAFHLQKCIRMDCRFDHKCPRCSHDHRLSHCPKSAGKQDKPAWQN